jgi:hypothetical protein
MFRLLGVILRPSIEPNQDYVITSALWDPVALTIGGFNAVWNYSLVFKMTVGSAGTGLFCGCNDGFRSRCPEAVDCNKTVVFDCHLYVVYY